MWLGTTTGIIRLTSRGEPAELDVVGDVASLTDQRIQVMEKAGPDSVWVGTRNGLNRVDRSGHTIERILPETGDPHSLSSAYVATLATDQQGRLWVGTYSGGISVLEKRDASGKPRFRRIGFAEGLTYPNVSKILVDAQGNIWATNDGIVFVDSQTFAVRRLQFAEGVALQKYWGNSGAKTPNGELLFGATGGLTVIRPELLAPWQFHPPIAVTDIRIGGKNVKINRFNASTGLTPEPLVISPAANSVAVEFSALDYSAPERNQYQYRLEGFDDDWSLSDATRRLAAYTNLPPGDYRLRIRGSNRDGLWSEREVALPLHVLPPWYRTWWSYIGFCLLAAAAFWLTLKWRLRRVQLATKVLERTVFERTAALNQKTAELQIANVDLERAKGAAETATQAKSIFLANMSHEIRTPMNAVLGFADLGSKLVLPPKALDYFRKINRAGRNLLGILNDILDFSKIEAGKITLEAVPYKLSDVLSQIVDLFSMRAAQHGLELVVGMAPGVPENLIGDPLRLGQVLANLVNNALKFTHSGYIRLNVERIDSAEASDTRGRVRLRFAVDDSGVGMSKDQLSQLFQPFTQADASTARQYGGTGLGLTISERLVEQMGGKIEVTSEPGRGSRFFFELDFASARIPSSVRLVPAHLRGVKILIVDDNAQARELLETQLTSFRFIAVSVDSGEMAIRALASESFSLVLLDWMMPGLDGIDTARRIQANPGLADIPRIIMVTAFDREGIEAAAYEAGITAVLEKPVNPSSLLDAIVNSLDITTATPAQPAQPREAAPAEILRGVRVLVADDNLVNQELALEILGSAGAIADIAGSGAQAIQMVDGARYDAVLMDIQMPEMDGFEASLRIREKTQHRFLPIIAMTAHAYDVLHEQCLVAGMNDHISKPIDPDELIDVLRKHLRLTSNQSHVDRVTDVGLDLPNDLPGIDLQSALHRVNGNKSLLRRLLSLFATEHRRAKKMILETIESNELLKAANLVHSITGSAGNLSATRLHACAAALEDALRKENRKELPALISDFNGAFDQILTTASRIHSSTR